MGVCISVIACLAACDIMLLGLSRDLVEKLLCRSPCIGAFGSLLHAVPQLLDGLFVSFNTRQGLRKGAVRCVCVTCLLLSGWKKGRSTHAHAQTMCVG